MNCIKLFITFVIPMLASRALQNSIRHSSKGSNPVRGSAALVLAYITAGVVAPFVLPLKSTITNQDEN